MYPEKLKELILAGESSTVEFKRKFTSSEKIAKEVAAFANTIGGYLIFGVDDDGKIIGVESEKSEIDLIETACEFFVNPPVEHEIYIVSLNGKDVVVVRVKNSDNKPHKVIINHDEKKSELKAYIRVGEESVVASKEMTKVLATQNRNSEPVKLAIGEKEKALFIYLEKHGKATIKDFSDLVNISKRRATQLTVRLVKAGVLQIHNSSESDYFTLLGK